MGNLIGYLKQIALELKGFPPQRIERCGHPRVADGLIQPQLLDPT
ncbi:MAG: hypothetical protein AAFV53_33490 [Myxococcota bacterium]